MSSLEAVDDTYRDPSRPIDERVEALLRQLTLSEKAGLFFHRMIGMGRDGELADADPTFGSPSTEDLVVGAHLTHFNLFGELSDPAQVAGWHNRLQELAASTRLGIPVTVSTDPRHSFTDNPGAAVRRGRLLGVAGDRWGLRRSATRTSSRRSLTSRVRSTSRSGSGWPCTRRSTWPPSPAGPAR